MLTTEVLHSGLAMAKNNQTDTSVAVKILPYADIYYGNLYPTVSGRNVPFFVSSARKNEFNINLAAVKFIVNQHRYSLNITPAFGTYMQANYAAEPAGFRYLVEANAGVLLSEKKQLRLDAGLLPSPYTNENAFSAEHLLYTRSLAAENSPYYLTGAKLSAQPTKNLHIGLYVVNGWQQIRDANPQKSIGTLVQYTKNKHQFSWSNYIGYEKSKANPNYGMRYFTEANWLYCKAKFSTSSCVYMGMQQIVPNPRANYYQIWAQANICARQYLTPQTAIAGRLEYFLDPDNIFYSDKTNSGIMNASATGSFLWQPVSQTMLRAEARYFAGKYDQFGNTLWLGNHQLWWFIVGMSVMIK